MQGAVIHEMGSKGLRPVWDVEWIWLMVGSGSGVGSVSGSLRKGEGECVLQLQEMMAHKCKWLHVFKCSETKYTGEEMGADDGCITV